MAELDRQGQPPQRVQKLGEVPATGGIAGEPRRELQQQCCELLRLEQRADAFPVLGGLAAPLAGVDLVSQGAGQLGGEAEAGRGQPAHALDGRCLGHLVPGEIELGDAELPGIQGQHLAGLGPRRVKPGVGPLGVRVAAGPYENGTGGVLRYGL